MNVSKIAFGTHFVFNAPAEDKQGRMLSTITQTANRLKTALTSQNHPENTLIHVFSPLTVPVEVRLTPHPNHAGEFKQEIYWSEPREVRSIKPKDTHYGDPSAAVARSIIEDDTFEPSDSFISTKAAKQEPLNNTSNGEGAKYFPLRNSKEVNQFLRSLTFNLADHFRQSETFPKPAIKVPERANPWKDLALSLRQNGDVETVVEDAQ